MSTKYICHKRFGAKAICGEVNISATTECEEANGFIFCDGKTICACKSENAHQHFARNDDGQGMMRGKLTQAIQKSLAKRDKAYQARWDKVWSDPICQKYKRSDHEEFWLWNHEFFNAEIVDLYHIAAIIGAKIKEVKHP